MTQHGPADEGVTQVIPGRDGNRAQPGAPEGPRRLLGRTQQRPGPQAGGDREPGPYAQEPPRDGVMATQSGQQSNMASQDSLGSDHGRVRRARLRTVRVDPWSVMKTAFLLSVAFGIMIVVAVAVIWNVLEAAGVYSSINTTVVEVLGSGAEGEFDLYNYVGFRRVLGVTALIGVIDVVLVTALATLGAFLYNLSASLLGGIELTLAEDE